MVWTRKIKLLGYYFSLQGNFQMLISFPALVKVFWDKEQKHFPRKTNFPFWDKTFLTFSCFKKQFSIWFCAWWARTGLTSSLERFGLISSHHDFKNNVKVWAGEPNLHNQRPSRSLAKCRGFLKEFYLFVLPPCIARSASLLDFFFASKLDINTKQRSLLSSTLSPCSLPETHHSVAS